MADYERLEQRGAFEWALPADGRMKVPGRLYADETTVNQLRGEAARPAGWSALRQIANVACLPGIVDASIALPDVHPGYGFPIGGVAAFEPANGVVAAGGVGFDINCGVRLLSTPLSCRELEQLDVLGEALHRTVPAGLGSTGALRMSMAEIDRVLTGGAPHVVELGYGVPEDIEYIEERGCIGSADATAVSELAKKRQFAQVGTLGSGNHYVEIQRVDKLLDAEAAEAYGLFSDQIVVSIHTGSRALGHQIGQDYLEKMRSSGKSAGHVPEPELACAPIDSDLGAEYLGAVGAGANCAFANRQVIGHLVRQVFVQHAGLSETQIRTVYDIGHNNAKFETHRVDGIERRLLVHRKGATRAFGPNHPEVPARYRAHGHPVLVGGTMGTASFVLRGTPIGMTRTFGSAIHGAGRLLSRKKAAKRFWGDEVVAQLGDAGIRIYAHSRRGVAEEAPGAYKDVERVIEAAAGSGIVQPVARLRPLVVIKG